MTEIGIPKNVIIFGAAMSCMEKCSRADIAFQLMKRMKEEGIAPNVHIYNSAISACARCGLWEKGYELYEEMDREGVKRDVVTFNAGTCEFIRLCCALMDISVRSFSCLCVCYMLVLDAVCSQIQLGRRLFEVGVERGFYAKVSRLGEQWFELDLHFLSLGGGEIALGWWFEECLVPYLSDTDKLANVKSISIVTGYGKTRTRGRRHGDDGMRKRCKAMLRFMGITESDQPNLGRIHIDKESLIEDVKKNGGRIIFDLDGYLKWKEAETTANVIPDTVQKIRARFKPTVPGSGRPPFTRVENEFTSDEYRLENQQGRLARIREQDIRNKGEYQADTDYAARDGINYEQGMDEPIGRLRVGRPDPRHRGDSIGHNGVGPGRNLRLDPGDSGGWIDREPSVNGVAYLQNRPGYIRDLPRGEDQVIYSDSPFGSVHRSVRGSNRDFYPGGPSLGRCDEPPQFAGRLSDDNSLRYVDRAERYDEWRGIGRDRQDDRGREAFGSTHHNASFRSGDRDIASDQVIYPVSRAQPQQFAVDRSRPVTIVSGGGRGHEYQHIGQFDSAHFNGVGRSERDTIPLGNHFRHNGRSASFEEGWRIGDTSRFGPDSLRDSFSDHRDFPRQVQPSRTGVYRDDGRSRNIDYPVKGHPDQYNNLEVNYKTSNRLPDYQEHDSRAFQPGIDHKRQFEVISQQPQGMNLTHGISSGSRGYALEPQSQRRRFS
jgi:pentatricopeptide repeat protein